jgi:hypothetical protein
MVSPEDVTVGERGEYLVLNTNNNNNKVSESTSKAIRVTGH